MKRGFIERGRGVYYHTSSTEVTVWDVERPSTIYYLLSDNGKTVDVTFLSTISWNGLPQQLRCSPQQSLKWKDISKSKKNERHFAIMCGTYLCLCIELKIDYIFFIQTNIICSLKVLYFQFTSPGVKSRALLWVWTPDCVKSKISDLQDKAAVHDTARWREATVTVQGTVVQIVHALHQSQNVSITVLYSTVSENSLDYKTQTLWPLQCLAWGNTWKSSPA